MITTNRRREGKPTVSFSLRAVVFLPFPLPFYTLRSSALLAFDYSPAAIVHFSEANSTDTPFTSFSIFLLLPRIMHSGAPSERLKKIHTPGLCSTCKRPIGEIGMDGFFLLLPFPSRQLKSALLNMVLFINVVEYMHAHDCFPGQCGKFTLLYSTCQ